MDGTQAVFPQHLGRPAADVLAWRRASRGGGSCCHQLQSRAGAGSALCEGRRGFPQHRQGPKRVVAPSGSPKPFVSAWPEQRDPTCWVPLAVINTMGLLEGEAL